MPARSHLHPIFRFGVFELDPEARRLFKRGIRLPLGGQPLDVLLALVENPGEIVSRDSLRRRLWPEEVHVEFETNLNKIVNRLRTVLGDSSDQPIYVETIPGRGYRFLVPVEVIEVVPAITPTRRREPEPVRPETRRRRWKMAALVPLAVLGIAAAALVLAPREREQPNWRPAPLTSYEGRELSPSFAPDGNRIAFVWNGEAQDNFDIYTLAVGAARPLRLTSDPAREYSPAWSPDGKLIAFLRDLGAERTAVCVMPSEGGSVRQVSIVRTPPTGHVSMWIPGRMLTWSHNGRYLAVSDGERGEDRFALFAVAVSGGEMRRLTTPSAQHRGDLAPSVSPDGRLFAFVRRVVVNIGTEIHWMPVSEDLSPVGQPRRLTATPIWIDGLDWSADGRSVIAAVSPAIDGMRSLIRIPVSSSGSPSALNAVGLDTIHPAVAPAAKRLSYVQQNSRVSGVWRIRLSQPGVAAGPAERVLASTSSNMAADLSPDGTKIAFRSLRSGAPAVWIANVDGSGILNITPPGAGGAGNPAWSPDGARIAIQAGFGTSTEIVVIDADGTRHRRLTEDSHADLFPTWSRDSRWLYFTSNRAGSYDIWRIPTTGGQPVRVSRNGGFCLKESVDGERQYVGVGYRDSVLFEMPTAGGAPSRLVGGLANPSAFAVTAAGIYHVVSSGPDGSSNLCFYDFISRRSSILMSIRRPVDLGLSVSADGRTLAFSQIERDESTLMLVEGFR